MDIRRNTLRARRYAGAAGGPPAGRPAGAPRGRKPALARGFEAVPRPDLLDNPQVSTEKKLQYLADALGRRIDPILDRMLPMLVRRDRVRYLAEIFDYFGELADEEQGIGRAAVETARQLGDDERRRLTETFEVTRATAEHRVAHRPALFGAPLPLRDLMIDGSLSRVSGNPRTPVGDPC